MKNPIPLTQVIRAIRGIVFTSAFHSQARVRHRYETNLSRFAKP